MSKTAPIPDDVHTLILDKQAELKEKHKIKVKISDLIAMYVRDSIKKTEKLLGLKTEDDSGDTSKSGRHNASSTAQNSADVTEHNDTKDAERNGMSDQESTIQNAEHNSSIIDEGAEVKI